MLGRLRVYEVDSLGVGGELRAEDVYDLVLSDEQD